MGQTLRVSNSPIGNLDISINKKIITSPTEGLIQDSAVSPLITGVPKEIWKNHVCIYLSKQDLSQLRLVCLWFRLEIVDYPFWKQRIPFHLYPTLLLKYSRFGWNVTFHSLKIFVITELKFISFRDIPNSIVELNLIHCKVTPSGIEHLFKSLPQHITQLILAWTESLMTTPYENLLLRLYETHPNLQLIFEGNHSFLYFACYFGNSDFIRALLRQKKVIEKELNQRNGCLGNTPLIISSFLGKTEILELLIQAGADINMKDKYGHSAYTHAKMNNRAEIVNILQRYGAKIEKNETESNL